MAIISTTKNRTESVETIPFDDAIESPISDSSIPLSLTKHQIIELWDAGILSPTSYVYLAIQYEFRQTGEVEYKLDFENFAFNWRGVGDGETGKRKELKKKQIMNAICVLEEKELLSMIQEDVQLSLV